MDSAADEALKSTTAGVLGYWFGGFIITMAVAYIFLRFAGSPKRRPITAIILRILAVIAAVFLVYAEYLGGGSLINLGGLLAIVITILWALKQQFMRKSS